MAASLTPPVAVIGLGRMGGASGRACCVRGESSARGAREDRHEGCCLYTNRSGRDVLHLEDVDRPEPAAGEVRVRVCVSGVNPTDYKTRSGATARPIDGFQIPHQDGAGIVDAVGESVDPARVGQEVWIWFAATRRWGTAAQWTVVPQEHAVPLPAGASMDLGASLGVPAMTAHRCLHADGPITGKSVLVAGGAGAVGHFAIELARHAGPGSPRQ